MDTLDLANDYVNLKWEEFEKSMDKSFFRKYCSICQTTENTETSGKVFRFQEMVKCV